MIKTVFISVFCYYFFSFFKEGFDFFVKMLWPSALLFWLHIFWQYMIHICRTFSCLDLNSSIMPFHTHHFPHKPIILHKDTCSYNSGIFTCPGLGVCISKSEKIIVFLSLKSSICAHQQSLYVKLFYVGVRRYHLKVHSSISWRQGGEILRISTEFGQI